MKPIVLGGIAVLAAVTVAASLSVATLAAAQRADPLPSPPPKFALATYLPVGVASEAATGSTAWFIDTTNNRVISCSRQGGCTAHSIPAP